LLLKKSAILILRKKIVLSKIKIRGRKLLKKKGVLKGNQKKESMRMYCRRGEKDVLMYKKGKAASERNLLHEKERQLPRKSPAKGCFLLKSFGGKVPAAEKHGKRAPTGPGGEVKVMRSSMEKKKKIPLSPENLRAKRGKKLREKGESNGRGEGKGRSSRGEILRKKGSLSLSCSQKRDKPLPGRTSSGGDGGLSPFQDAPPGKGTQRGG